MNFGDVIDVDFGTPIGSEAGFLRPAVVCTADAASFILVEQLRAVSHERCSQTGGNVGVLVAHQIIDIIAMLIGIP